MKSLIDHIRVRKYTLFLHTIINILTHFQLNLIIYGTKIKELANEWGGGDVQKIYTCIYSRLLYNFFVLFKSLTRSSNNLSQLNQFSEIWCPFLLLRHLCDLHEAGMLAIFYVYYFIFSFYSLNNSL